MSETGAIESRPIGPGWHPAGMPHALFWGLEMEHKRYAINRHDVVDEVIDGEAILINLKTGRYYSLEGSACLFWERLRHAPIDAGALAEFMQHNFVGGDDDAVGAATRFLDEMVEEGLIGWLGEADLDADASADTAAPAPMAGAPAAPAPFEPPVLTKYTDMEALLLIDPIHDVSEEGWPRRPEDTA
ncbi:MAG: PqqD family protein [Burkholderiaceae bacterium]|nr:PqqD family protein [Burkholderiaceae bacterium]